MIKKFVPCMYLKDEKAVKSFDCLDIVSDDPVLLAEKYNDADIQYKERVVY